MVFKHKLMGQTLPFAAKTTYCSTKKCRDFLRCQLANYDRFTFKFDKDWTESEEQEFRQRANTAVTNFRTLFCDKSRFESPGVTVKTLARNYSKKGHHDLLDKMAGWYKERLRGQRMEDDASFTFCQGNTAVELRSILDPLITPHHACDTPSLWPLVKEVQIGIPSSRVLRYLTIHDLPGMSLGYMNSICSPNRRQV